MKKIFLGGLCAVLIAVPVVSKGFTFEQNKDAGTGSLSTLKGNLYTAGGALNVSIPTAGDLFAAGGNIAIQGSTTADLFAAGGNISVLGAVGDDVRIAGGTILLSGKIGGDLMAAGGQVNLDQAASVGKEAFLNGGSVTVGGSIAGASNINGEKVVISGTLNGPTEIHAESLVITQTAVINGTIKYVGPTEARVEEGAQVGTIDYSKSAGPSEAKRAATFIPLAWIIKFLAMLAAALVLYFVLDRRNADQIKKKEFGLDALRGLVLLILIPIASIILMATVIGLWVGIVGLVLYALFILLGAGYAGILAGKLLNQWFIHRPMGWMIVAIGVFAVEIIALIPILGWLACFILFLAAFGTLSNRLYRAVRT